MSNKLTISLQRAPATGSPRGEARVSAPFFEAGRRLRAHLGERWFAPGMIDALAKVFGESAPTLFTWAIEFYETRCAFPPAARGRERAMAIDVLNAVARLIMEQSPAANMPAPLLTYEYMKRHAAPLPPTYSAAKRALIRVNQKVNSARDPRSRMSLGWRLHWLGLYPLSDALVRQYGQPKDTRERRKRRSRL